MYVNKINFRSNYSSQFWHIVKLQNISCPAVNLGEAYVEINLSINIRGLWILSLKDNYLDPASLFLL